MRATRFYSDKQEKEVARQLNGKQQINSGATPFYKGDVITENLLVECKTLASEQKSFTIKKEWLDTIKREALIEAKIPVLAFDFGTKEKYYILTERGMKTLIGFLEELENDN